MRRASKFKVYVSCYYSFVYGCVGGRSNEFWVGLRAEEQKKPWLRVSFVMCTHTRTHAHLHTSRVETVQLSSCCAVLSYAVLPAVLCERSIGPLCSEAHGKQGPVGRCLPRPGMLLCSLVAQPSHGAVRYRSEL